LIGAALRPNGRVTAAWLAGLLLLHCGNMALLATLPIAYALIGWPLGGLVLWGLWTVGHDSIHGAAARNSRLNTAIGIVAFMPTLHPWHATRTIHNRHHRHLNDVVRDTAWNPWTDAQYEAQSPVVRAVYRHMRQELWWLGTMLFLRRHSLASSAPGNIGGHYSNLGLIAFWVAACLAATWHTGASIAFVFVAPLVAFGAIFSTITLLHHSQVDGDDVLLPWRADSSGTRFVRDHTVDYELPWPLQRLLFHGNLHTLHHLAPGIPFYAWPRARALIDRKYPRYVRSTPFRFRYLTGVLKRQHLFDVERKRIIPFSQAKESKPCEKPASSPAARAASGGKSSSACGASVIG
jgi:fatty acid desaturase